MQPGFFMACAQNSMARGALTPMGEIGGKWGPFVWGFHQVEPADRHVELAGGRSHQLVEIGVRRGIENGMVLRPFSRIGFVRGMQLNPGLAKQFLACRTCAYFGALPHR